MNFCGNKIIFTIAILFILNSRTSAANTVLFLGFFESNSPALSKNFEKKLRQRLAVSPDFELIDYIETQRYRKMVKFDRYPSLSSALLRNLDRYITDSTLILSGEIQKINFIPVRKRLFRSVVEGELLVNFSIFDLHQKTFAFSITIHGRATREKGRILFGNVEKITTLSAAERLGMTDDMTADALTKSSSTIRSVVRSMQMQSPPPQNTIDAEVNNQPSISDVFTVPSVEATKIDEDTPDTVPRPEITEETIAPEKEMSTPEEAPSEETGNK
jgi:hypothetical protein